MKGPCPDVLTPELARLPQVGSYLTVSVCTCGRVERAGYAVLFGNLGTYSGDGDGDNPLLVCVTTVQFKESSRNSYQAIIRVRRHRQTPRQRQPPS